MGFITNVDDEQLLKTPADRGRLMDAVAGSIESYFTAQTRLAAR
jgi:N-acetylmuramoyl-L-alanine amidase